MTVQIPSPRMLRWRLTDVGAVHCFDSGWNKILPPTIPTRTLYTSRHAGERYLTARIEVPSFRLWLDLRRCVGCVPDRRVHEITIRSPAPIVSLQPRIPVT